MVGETWITEFPGLEGWYWADDGSTVQLVWVSPIGESWAVWNPLDDLCGNKNTVYAIDHYVKWTRCPLRPPMPDGDLKPVA